MPKTAQADFAIHALAAALPAGDGALPEWVTIFPKIGDVLTRDNRRYIVDAAALIARFESDGVDIPVDVNHSTDTAALIGSRSDAVGWISRLRVAGDALLGKVEWLDDGKALLAAKKYRFLSPSFHHTPDGKTTWLKAVALVTAPALGNQTALARAGLVNKPNFDMPALNSAFGDRLKALRDAKGLTTADLADAANISPSTMQAILDGDIARPPDERISAWARQLGTTKEELLRLIPSDRRDSEEQIQGKPVKASAAALNSEGSTMKSLSNKLGLAETANEAALLHALDAGFVPKKVHDEALAQLSATTTKLAEIETASRKARVDALLEGALKDKKILPAERDHYATLCATNSGFESVKALLAAKAVALPASGLDAKKTPEGGAMPAPAQLAAQANKMVAAGEACDFLAAMAALGAKYSAAA